MKATTYKIYQTDDKGVEREVQFKGEAVRGFDFKPSGVELKEFDEDTRSFLAVGSTPRSDRVSDIIDIKGWNVDDFLNNPVGMWAHNYNQLPIFRIADLDINTRKKKMIFRAQFDDFEFANTVFNSYRKGFMRGFSVGMIPLKYEFREEEDMTDEEKAKAGWFGGIHFKQQELLEISAAPIPMNPDALAGMKSLGLPVKISTVLDSGFPKAKMPLHDGSIWFPIGDPELFVEPAIVAVGEDVRAVTGKRIDGEGSVKSIVAHVIGYIFPKGYDLDGIHAWLLAKGVTEETVITYMDFVKSKNDLEPVEIERGEEGITVLQPEPLTEDEVNTSSVEEEEDDDGLVTFTQEDEAALEPKSISIDSEGLVLDTNFGLYRFSTDWLSEHGVGIEGNVLYDKQSKDTLDTLLETLKGLATKANVAVEPEPEIPESQPEDALDELMSIEAAVEELGAECGDDVVELLAETLEEVDVADVIERVLSDALSTEVDRAVITQLRVVSGDLE